MARYCILSSHEALEFQRGKLPNCRQHEHVPASVAETECETGQAWLAGRGRIVRNEQKEWSGSRSVGFSVMQMVPVFRDKIRAAGNNNTPSGKHHAPRGYLKARVAGVRS